MTDNKKLKPQTDFAFKLMTWLYRAYDRIHNTKQDLKKIPLEEVTTVVDYGCGPGRYTLPVAKLVGIKGKVFAVDIHPLAIKTIKEKAAQESLTNIEAILVDSYDTGIQDSSVDLVLLIDTLPLIKDYNQLFQEIHRILKQKGYIFIEHGRTKLSRTREIVERTGLFYVIECKGHQVLAVSKAKR
ncbi:MAG TPA: class I SAM-dependent methyltransferase [Dehalococcoidia bacterium]|nr:class I SAM-dependent methyltransferase [Dehalococcoidia bacterium]